MCVFVLGRVGGVGGEDEGGVLPCLHAFLLLIYPNWREPEPCLLVNNTPHLFSLLQWVRTHTLLLLLFLFVCFFSDFTEEVGWQTCVLLLDWLFSLMWVCWFMSDSWQTDWMVLIALWTQWMSSNLHILRWTQTSRGQTEAPSGGCWPAPWCLWPPWQSSAAPTLWASLTPPWPITWPRSVAD